MKALLSQIALLAGGGVALLSLICNLLRRMDFLTAAFRAALVFLGTVLVLFVFLQLFSTVLVRFVAEQVVRQRSKGETKTKDSPVSGPGRFPPPKDDR